MESDAPRIVQARSELEGALRRAARAGGQDTLWTWLGSESGRDDLRGLREFIREAPPEDPRVSVAVARMNALQERWAT